MKKITGTIALLFLVTTFLFANNGGGDKNDNKASSCEKQTLAYQAGEYLKYKVYYNWTAVWMNAGNVTFTVNNDQLDGEDVLHMVAEGRTAKGFNWFYKVHDRYETYMSPSSSQPLKFIRNVNEGNYTKYNEYTFLPDQSEVLINKRTRMGKLQAENETLSVPSCTQDMLSAVYYTRNIDYSNMAVGDKINVELLIDGEITSAFLKYMGKDKLKTKLGKFNCAKFAPSLIAGDVFEGDEEMIIWVTDDDNRLPLLIESPLSVGWAKAYLIDYDNLKYSMDAKITKK